MSKVSIIILMVIGVLQPVIWWFIYSLVNKWAIAHSSEAGLSLICILMPIIFMVSIAAFISPELDEDNL